MARREEVNGHENLVASHETERRNGHAFCEGLILLGKFIVMGSSERFINNGSHRNLSAKGQLTIK